MMMVVKRMARLVSVVELARHQHQHGADHRHRDDEDQSPARTARRRGRAQSPRRRRRCRRRGCASRSAAARLVSERLQEHAGDRDRRNDQPDQEHRFARQKMLASHPDRPATARMPTDSARRPSTCTMPSSARTSSSGRGIAVGVGAGHHLGRHGVGDHVLNHGADHDQHGAENIELVRAAGRRASRRRRRQASACRWR